MFVVEYSTVFVLDDLIHRIKRIERVGLLFTVNRYGVGELWKVSSDSFDVVSDDSFFGTGNYSKDEELPTTSCIELPYTFYGGLI